MEEDRLSFDASGRAYGLGLESLPELRGEERCILGGFDRELVLKYPAK